MKEKLSGRIHIEDVYEILIYVEGDDKRRQQLLDLAINGDDTTSYQALWVFTHFNRKENKWLYDKQDQLIDSVMKCAHPGRRRLLLNLIYKLPLPDPLRVDFLDFCLDKMLSKDELPGVQTLCMKLAYELCLPIPELLQELRSALELMEEDLLPPSIRSVRKKVLQAMKKKKSLSGLPA